MGQSRAERTWRRPRRTRHVWVRLRSGKHPHEPPRQGLLIAWRKRGFDFEALVVVVDDLEDAEQPVIVQRWFPAADLRPVAADPNRAFGLR